MAYKVREEGGYAIVELTGEVDLAVAPVARQTLLDAMDRTGSVLVDLSSVAYIDSSGVACLIECFQAARKSDGKFGLVGVSDAVMGVLKLARLDNVFPVYASVGECLGEDG